MRPLSASQLAGGNIVLMAAGSVIALAVGSTVGRLAGPEQFGHLRTVLAVGATAGTLAQFGLATVALRDPAGPGASWARLTSYLRAMAVPSLVACAGAALYLTRTDAHHLLGTALVFLVVAAVGAVVGSGARAAGRLWATTVGHSIVEPTGLLLVAVGGVATGVALTSQLLLTTVVVLSIAVTLGLQGWSVRWAPERPSAGPWRPLVGRASATLTVADVASVALGLAPALVLGWRGSATDVGLFGAAAAIAGPLALPLGAVNTTVSPAFARCWREGDRQQVVALARGSAGFALTLALLPCLAVLVWAPWLLDRLFGAAYVPAAAATRWLVLGALVNVATGSTGALLRMIGRDRTVATTNLAAAVLTLAALSVLGTSVGGAAASVSLGVAVSNLAQVACVQVALGSWTGADLRSGLSWWRRAPDVVVHRAPAPQAAVSALPANA